MLKLESQDFKVCTGEKQVFYEKVNMLEENLEDPKRNEYTDNDRQFRGQPSRRQKS